MRQTTTSMRRRKAIAGALIAAAVISSAVTSRRAVAQSASSSRPAAATDAPLPDSADAYRIAADGWIKRYKPDSLVLIVKRGGRIVYSRAENRRLDEPTLLASLSKMITAVCVATLVRDEKLDFDTPMRDALSGFLARNGQPADPRFLDVTVAQLLTHRSGMMGNPDGDVLFKMVRDRAARGEGAKPAIQEILAQHLKHPLKRAPGQGYAYSNPGYLALGAIIEDRSKRPYEDYCQDAVMKPLKIASAKLHPDWRIWSSMGGWTIAPQDYLAIADVLSPDHPFLGEKVKTWIDTARFANGGADNWYSLGVFTIASPRGGWSIGHGGQLNSRGADQRKRPTTAIVRSTFARAADGTAMFAAFTPARYDNKALNDLRASLARATQAWGSFR